MSKEDDNKAVAGRWFTSFWGEKCDLGIVDEIAAPDMLLKYSLHDPRVRSDARLISTDIAEPDMRSRGSLPARRSFIEGSRTMSPLLSFHALAAQRGEARGRLAPTRETPAAGQSGHERLRRPAVN